jgi:hypothetical protein
MFSYQYYLDTTLFDGADYPIKDIEEFEEVLERDYDKRGILVKYPTRIAFVNSAYDYIKNVRDTDTFCGEIDFKLLIGRENNTFEEYQIGKIYVSTSTFNLNDCTVECEVVDNSYFAKILNNYKCEALLASNKSKNNVTITPCPYIEIKPFDPSTGGNLADSRYGVDVYDALKFLVQFMSDGEITFQSDWFDNNVPGTDWKTGVGNNGMLIINGEALRDTTGSSVKAEVWITFEKLFKNVSKLLNLWFYIKRNADGSLTMKAERYNVFQNDNILATFRYTTDLELSFDNTNLYAAVEVGSNTNNYTITTADYIGYIPALTFYPETYNVAGQCNNANTLDLKSELVTDHNLIVYQTLQATDDNNYDNYHYLVLYDNSMSNPHDCNKYDTFKNPPYGYYNRYLMNDWVLEMTDFHGELVKNNNPGDVLFNVYNNSSVFNYDDNLNPIPAVINEIIPFDTELADPGNDFNTSTYKWTCPADGFYSFNLKVVFEITKFKQYNDPAHTGTFSPIIAYSSIVATPNIASPIVLEVTNIFEGTFTYNVTFADFYKTGDIEWVDFTLQILQVLPPPVTPPLPTYYEFDFELTGSQLIMDYSTNGGILKPNDKDNILINKFAFKSNISYSNWNSIKVNADKAYQLFISQNDVTKAWAKSIRRKVLSGNTNVELITNNINY